MLTYLGATSIKCSIQHTRYILPEDDEIHITTVSGGLKRIGGHRQTSSIPCDRIVILIIYDAAPACDVYVAAIVYQKGSR